MKAIGHRQEKETRDSGTESQGTGEEMETTWAKTNSVKGDRLGTGRDKGA